MKSLEDAKADLEYAVKNIPQNANQNDVQTYWNAFKAFCFQPIGNEGQSVVLSCITADLPINGYAFYVTFKRIIWSTDDDDELNIDQISCSLACKASIVTQALSLNFGGEPFSDSEYAEALDTIEHLLSSNGISELTPVHSSVYIS